MKRVLAVGEPIAVLRTVHIGGIDTTSDLVVGSGGAECNVAIGLSRLGVATSVLGRVGDDALGRRLLRDLRSESVTPLITVDPNRRTALLIKETPRAGQTRVSYYRHDSAGARLHPDDLVPGLVAGFDLVHTTGITSQLSDDARGATRRLAQQATEHGVPFAFDVNHRSKLARSAAREDYMELASQATVLFAGIDEAEMLVGVRYRNPLDLANALGTLVDGDVVLKLGAKGAILLTRDGQSLSAQPPDVEVVDTVGAGDALAAGYLSALLEGADPLARLHRGLIAGALACSVPGDWEGVPRIEDLRTAAAVDPVDR